MYDTTITAPDLDEAPSAGDVLHVLARHIDDYELPVPCRIAPPLHKERLEVQVGANEWAEWTSSLTTWTGETSFPWDGKTHVTALGTIGRVPVQLVTVQAAAAVVDTETAVA